MFRTSLVLLDLDGTLLDESGLPEAMRRTCDAIAAAAPGLDSEALRRADAEVWAAWWPEIEDDWMEGGRSGADLVAEAWRRALEACDVRDEDVLAAATATWAREAFAAHRLHDDALPLLDALDTSGTRVGLVSNGAADLQRAKLAAVGLADRLEPVVVSGEVGTRKPGAQIFEIALAAAGAPAAETVYVGDNLWHDVPGALQAGLRAIWLDRSGAGLPTDAPVPSATVRGLLDLLPLLGR